MNISNSMDYFYWRFANFPKIRVFGVLFSVTTGSIITVSSLISTNVLSASRSLSVSFVREDSSASPSILLMLEGSSMAETIAVSILHLIVHQHRCL